MSQITLVTDRQSPVLNLDDVKSYMKIDSEVDNFSLNLMINAAADMFENWTNRILITKVFSTSFEDFGGCLRKGNFQSLVSSQYSYNGVWTPWDPTQFTVVQDGPYPYFYLPDSVTLPTFDEVPNPFQVTWKAGYGDKANNIPYAVQLSLLQMILYLYENRGDYDPGKMPTPLESLISQYRIRSIARG